MERPGKCRWCGCTYEEPCPGSCGWANAKQTLCTACVNLDREWSHLPKRIPNMRRAFFRGYMVGSDDERADLGGLYSRAVGSNPYPKGAAQRNWWQRGFDAGRKEAA
jgi:hypothetical protein